jgi:hypothetical protein
MAQLRAKSQPKSGAASTAPATVRLRHGLAVAFLLFWLGMIALVAGSEFETLDCEQQSAQCVSVSRTLLLFRVRHIFPVDDLSGATVSSEVIASKWSRNRRTYFVELQRKSSARRLALLPKRNSASDPKLRRQLADFEAFFSGRVASFSYSSGVGWFQSLALLLAFCLIGSSVWQAVRTFRARQHALKAAALFSPNVG